MYQGKLAAAIKSNGKVLREFGETVRLPFGSEYSLFIKNLNTVRALVRIEIDGKDISEGQGFIVQANSSIDIERFLKGNNMKSGNRFKFIERTARVEEHRGGPQVEDGLIRIEFEFERESVPVKDYHHYIQNPWKPPYRPYWGDVWGTQVTYSSTVSASAGDGAQAYASSDIKPASSGVLRGMPQNAVNSINTVNDAGITAPGSISHQQFQYGYIGALDGVKRAMVFKLVGEVGEVKVSKPITVKSKQKCVTCGHLNKAVAKFCQECGTALEIIA